MNDFINMVNYINSVFSNVTFDVKIKLFDTYCMPLYDCVLWDFCSKEFHQFCVAWRKALRKLLNISVITHNSLLHHVIGALPIDVQMYKRLLKFFDQNNRSTNEVINICTKLTRLGSGSCVSNSLSLICYNYGLSGSSNLFNQFKVKTESSENILDEDQIIASVIFDLLILRDYQQSQFSSDELVYMLNYVCTN